MVPRPDEGYLGYQSPTRHPTASVKTGMASFCTLSPEPEFSCAKRKPSRLTVSRRYALSDPGHLASLLRRACLPPACATFYRFSRFSS